MGLVEEIFNAERRRPRRPRRIDDLDLDLPYGVQPWNPDAGILQRGQYAPTDVHFRPDRPDLNATRPRRATAGVMPPQMVPSFEVLDSVSSTRPTRPRRTVEHLFGDDVDLIEILSGVSQGVTRPDRPTRTDEFAPYEGALPTGSFMGDSATPVNRALRPARPLLVAPDAPPSEISLPPVTLENIGAPPPSPYPTPVRRDFVSDAAQYLRDVESQPVERSRAKSFLTGLLDGGIPSAITGLARPELHGEIKRERNLTRARTQLSREIALQNQAANLRENEADLAYKGAQTDYLRHRPDIEANKALEQQRRTLASVYNRLPEFNPADPSNADLVDAMTAAGLPAVPKSRANQLRFVQDARTGEWKVLAGDRSTGEGIAQPVTTPEGESVATTPTATITTENQTANRMSRERIATLNRQSRETIAELNRRAGLSSGRGDAREQARLTRAVKDISDLENLKTNATSGPVAGRTSALEKAVTKATEIRRLYGDLIEVGYGGDSEGRQWPYAKMKGAPGVQQSGVIGRPPTADGKYHYTRAEVEAAARAEGKDPNAAYNALKGRKDVVIDQ